MEAKLGKLFTKFLDARTTGTGDARGPQAEKSKEVLKFIASKQGIVSIKDLAPFFNGDQKQASTFMSRLNTAVESTKPGFTVGDRVWIVTPTDTDTED